MMRYLVKGKGCPLGRLNTSIKDRFELEVEADSPESARLAVYDKFEHLIEVSIEPVSTGAQKGVS
jgi:hypothetical protein